MTYPIRPAQNVCNRCVELTIAPEDDYGEFICMSCRENEAEAAYERQCEAYHDGGSTQFRSLQQQQIDAMKFK